ncbi:MAG: tRNA pseudouridine(13) synthase TruD [Anaerolineae bacterium]
MDDLETKLAWHVPYLTTELPGVGGVIRTEVKDFVVDEVPAYEPSGEGEHVYLRVEKRNVSTIQLIQEVAQKLDISSRVIGSAGLKDTHAIARQTLSVHGVSVEAVEALQLDQARILWVKRHRNKLRAGHLRGNRFTVRIWGVVRDADTRAAAILHRLRVRGVPNAYGPQRFGNRGDNQILGYYLLHDDQERLASHGVHHLSRRLRHLFVSALQSALFNQVLAARIEAGTMDTVIQGDVAKKETTGGIFTVEDVTAERPRAADWEISATGPIYGYKMLEAKDAAGVLEAQVLARAGLTLDSFRSVRARGLRRPLRYNPEDATHRMDEEGHLIVEFFAPKGAFATVLLEELMKTGDVR